MNKLIYILMGIAIAMLLFSCDEEDLDLPRAFSTLPLNLKVNLTNG